jgi:hypothetical protein
VDGARVARRVQRTRWQADLFARGAHSYIAVGATSADLDTLAEPVDGRLFFAGEATVRQHGPPRTAPMSLGCARRPGFSGQRDLLPARHFTENRRWREMMLRANRFFNLRRRTLPRHDLDQRLAVLRLNPIFAAVSPAELHVLASMFDNGRRSATIWASGSTRALVLDYQRFQRFLLAFPESMRALLDETVRRLLEHEARVRPRNDLRLR